MAYQADSHHEQFVGDRRSGSEPAPPRRERRMSLSVVELLSSIKRSAGEAGFHWLVISAAFFGLGIGIIMVGLIRHHETLEYQYHATPITLTPKSDTRTYQHAILPNGLRIINVQDPTSKEGAFSMAVDAGSYDNPEDIDGLAHFCEHMLFLGTAKYPEPGGFDKFMAEAGGMNNAFTAAEHTVYYAQLSASRYNEGLSRFKDFFKAPLFSENFVAKEVHAIESEHAKNVKNSMRQIMGILSSLANPLSPVGRFQTGDEETLVTTPKKNGKNMVSELRKWFKKNYCPSRMVFATFGPDSLETQLAGVISLGDIPAGSPECQKPRRSWAKPAAWPRQNLGKLVYMKGIDPQPQIWMHFPFPDLRREYKSGVMDYINYVLSYGGENSLSRVLEDKLGYTSSFEISSQDASSGRDVYIIASLTKSGLEKYRQVVLLLFYYIAKLKNHGVDKALYQSLADANNLKWEWSEPGDASSTVSDLSERALEIPELEDLVSGRIDHLNSSLVDNLLGLISPQNMNALIVSPDMTFSSSQKVQTLAHYGAKYAVEDLATQFGTSFGSLNTWMHNPNDFGSRLQSAMKLDQLPVLPTAIEGVPKDISTTHMKAAPFSETEKDSAKKEKDSTKLEDLSVAGLYGKRPARLADVVRGLERSSGELQSKFLYREGWMSKSPKANVQISFKVPRTNASWENASLIDETAFGFYNSLAELELAPKVYDLTMTGVSYSVSLSPYGMSLSFGGFTPTLPRLIDNVLQAFDAGVNVTDTTRLDRLIAEAREALKTHSGMAVEYADEDGKLLLTPGATSREEQLEALEHVQPDLVAASGNRLKVKPMQVTGLAMGNIAEKEALLSYSRIAEHVKNWPGASMQPGAGEAIRRVKPVLKLPQPVELRRLNQQPGDTNDATIVTLMVGVATLESRVILGIISSILGNVAYDHLRTNLQLGYVVSGGVSRISNVQTISVQVQGEKMKADEVQGAIHHVLFGLMPEALSNMTNKEFLSHKKTLGEKLMQPPNAATEEFLFMWENANKDDKDCWGVQDALLQFLEKGLPDKKILSQTWNSIIAPSSARPILTVKHFAKEVPARPTLEESRKIWKKQGVPASAISLLEKEYSKAVVLNSSSSEQRLQLQQLGATYFDTTLHCKLQPTTRLLSNTDMSIAPPKHAAAERVPAVSSSSSSKKSAKEEAADSESKDSVKTSAKEQAADSESKDSGVPAASSSSSSKKSAKEEAADSESKDSGAPAASSKKAAKEQQVADSESKSESSSSSSSSSSSDSRQPEVKKAKSELETKATTNEAGAERLARALSEGASMPSWSSETAAAATVATATRSSKSNTDSSSADKQAAAAAVTPKKIAEDADKKSTASLLRFESPHRTYDRRHATSQLKPDEQ
jgi:insulysin